MKKYIATLYKLGNGDYVWMGMMVLLSPIIAPLFYTGVLFEWVMERD